MPEALHLLRPQWLLLLLPFALFTWIQWRRVDLRRQWEGHIAAHLLPLMIIPGNERRVFSPAGVAVLLYLLLSLALAGPSWKRGESPFAEDAAALVIAIDLSASMAQDDLQPSRLQRARSKALAVAKARGDAATALVAYAGDAYTVLPLTDDASVLLHYLDALEVGMLPREGKSPDTVIPLLSHLLRERDGGATLLIMGDGAVNESAAAFQGLGEAAGADVQLIVWGIGKTQAQLDADRERGLRASQQALQERQLKAIAAAGDGFYQDLSADDSDVSRVLRRIDRHYLLSDDNARPWLDGGYALVPLIMLLFLQWFRRGWVIRW